MKLSIIIPAHDEEDRIAPTLEGYLPYFAGRYGDDFELIVVVNGSSDATEQVVRGFTEGYPQLRVLVEPGKIGKGGAVIQGFDAATGELIGYVDADGSTPPEAFDDLVKRCGADDCDAAIASRWMKGSVVSPKQRFLRQLASRVFNGFTYLLFGMRYADTQCGAKVFRAGPLRQVRARLGITRWAFDVDLLFQLQREKATIRELPTIWHDVAGSKLAVTEASVEMFLALIRMRLVYSPLRVTVRWYERLFSRPVEFALRDTLFRHVVLLFFTSQLTAVGNVGFQMLVGRALPKPDYALLATFLALFAMVSRPLAMVRVAMAHYTSLLVQKNQGGVVTRLLKKWALLTGCISVALSMVCILFAREIAGFFHLSRVAPIVVSALALPAIFVAPVLSGALHGLQRFAWTSLSGVSNAVGRVLFGGLFVLCLYPACGWALAGHVVGMYVALLVCVAGLGSWYLKQTRDASELPRFRSYLLSCFLVQICAGFLLMGDVVLVKHYLPDDTQFAYAATLGRMVAFMAASVATAMFPKVASAGTFSTEHRSLYLRAQLYTWIFVGGALVVCFCFPSALHRFLFGIAEPSSELLWLTRWMGVAMAAAASLNLNVSLLLAQRRFSLLLSVVVCAVAYLFAVHLFHPTSAVVVGASGVANLVALIVTTFGILKGETSSYETID